MFRFKIVRRMKLVVFFVQRLKLFALVFCSHAIGPYAIAQSKLSQEVRVPEFKGAVVRDIFNWVNEKEGISFSYNSRLLNPDSVVNVKPFKGVLVAYLEKVLGQQFSFKETSSHIIINYAPQRMDVEVNIPEEINNRMMITGYIRDLRTDKAIPYASVYDRGAFVSTLTDRNGYFELDVKKPDNLIAISMSKEDYRDTSIMLLLPVEAAELLGKGGKLGYYSDYGQGKTVFSTFFGGLFSNSSQRLQSLNLAGVFAYSPFQVSLTPGLSTHGFFESQVVNKFSLNVLGGYTAGVDGFEMAGAFNINQYNVRGTQVGGLFNVVGGNVKGVQLAGGGNIVVHDLSGVQIGGIWNNVDTVKSGAQIAGALNLARQSKGVQLAGVTNISRADVGSQIAGGVNIAKSTKGVQLAGVTNISRANVGSQIAGGVNIAKKVKGIQLAGLVNIADSSDYPIGVFNFIKNGSKEFSISVDESKLVSFNFRSGGRVMYSLIGVGAYVDSEDSKYAVEFGIGANLIRRQRFSLATELATRTSFTSGFDDDVNRAIFRVIPRYHLTKNLQVYVAPSFNYSESMLSAEARESVGWKIWGADKRSNTFHGGASAGLVFHW